MKKYKISLLSFISFILLFGCDNFKPHYYQDSQFIHNPTLNMFGAKMSIQQDQFRIESYFRSSIIGRSEYIYENLDLTFPKDFKLNQKYNIGSDQVKIWYAKGGMSGQFETSTADGFFIIEEKTQEKIKINITVTFSNFSYKGSLTKVTLPTTIQRKGLLSAELNYDLY